MTLTKVADAPRLLAAETRIARDPSDLVRLARYVVILLLGIIAARGADRTTTGIEQDAVELAAHLPTIALALIIFTVQVLYLLLFLGIPLTLLVLRRFRLLGLYAIGWLITSLAVPALDALFGIGVGAALATPSQLPDEMRGWPDSQTVATAMFTAVVLAPYLRRQWRRFAWWFVLVLVLLSAANAVHVRLDLILTVGIGGTVGALMLVIFGRRVVRPSGTAVEMGLARLGMHPTEVVPADVPAAESLPFTATLPDGRRVHCKVVTGQQYQVDTVVRWYRQMRLRGLGEDLAYSSVRRAAAVEAMLATAARTAGVRTPAVLGLAPLPVADGMVIAFDRLDATPLSEVDPERITDDVLDQAWAALRDLRSAGLAHRDLELGSWMLDDADRLWLIDFSFGEPGASDGALSADIAGLLAVTYPVVGAQRAVAAGIRGLGPDGLAEGVSHLLPLALSPSIRRGLKGTGGLQALVDVTTEACGLEQPEFAPIERVKPRNLIMVGLLALAVYVLAPQLADLPRMIDAIREADPTYVLAAALASAVTYLGSGMAISGSAPLRVPVAQSTLAALAATFVGSVTPPGVAHAGVNARFLTKKGMTTAVAVSATAAKEVAVGAVHVALLVLLAILAGSTGALEGELDKLPPWQSLLIGLVVLLVAVRLAFALPRVRKLVRTTVLPAVRESIASLRGIAEDPVRMAILFLGGLLLEVGYVSALFLSARALGGDVSFVACGLVYLTVGAVASVAPTPGGLGAVEAVLLAALTGIGMAATPALAAVFLFRIVTFWVPIPLGALALRHLSARRLL